MEFLSGRNCCPFVKIRIKSYKNRSANHPEIFQKTSSLYLEGTLNQGCRIKVFDIVDLPISIGERASRIQNEIWTSWITRHCRTRLILTSVSSVIPNTICTGPISAESRVENVVMLIEEFVGRTRGWCKVCNWGSPGWRIGLFVGDVCWNAVSREPVYLDTSFSPNHYISCQHFDSRSEWKGTY